MTRKRGRGLPQSTPTPLPPPDLDADIARANAAAERLQATVQEANGVRSDLRLAIRDVRENIAHGIKDHIHRCVSEGLDAYKDDVAEAMKRSRRAIVRKFDQWTRMLVAPKDKKAQVALAAIELGNIIDCLAPNSIEDPEAAALVLLLKAQPDEADLPALNRLIELLRPLVKTDTDENAETD